MLSLPKYRRSVRFSTSPSLLLGHWPARAVELKLFILFPGATKGGVGFL